MRIEDVEYYFGGTEILGRPYIVYDNKVVTFLKDLSDALRHDAEARRFSDIQTFSFWIRHSNISRLKEEFERRNKGLSRCGRGIVFHIAPSNIPVIFAYTWVFGLLSGNANVVKVSSRNFEQTRIICRIAKTIAENRPCYTSILRNNMVIMYDREREDITGGILKECDAKVIWGGDATIEKIRDFETKPRCIELAFADRYSLALINTGTIMAAGPDEMKRLAHNFYNDSFLVDQNACSSPNLIFWVGDEAADAREKFYQALMTEETAYSLSDIKVSDKFVHSCEVACENNVTIRRYGNFIYDYKLKEIREPVSLYRGSCGEFYSYEIADIKEGVDCLDDEKIQTLLLYGVDREEVLNMIMKNGMKGVDRIVEIGKALDLGVIWDGYDVIGSLSRIVSI